MNVKKIKKAFGGFLMGFGIFNTALYSVVTVTEAFSKTTTENFNVGIGIAVVLGFGILPAILGYFLRKQGQKELQKLIEAEIQNAILRLARASNGIIKIADLMIDLKVTFEQAQELLATSVTNGLARAEVDENGNLYYIFRDFLKNNQINSDYPSL
ncbi:MAG: hypothetical protein ACPL1A_07925 [Candidatus Kapaibacteriota bacterium]